MSQTQHCGDSSVHTEHSYSRTVYNKKTRQVDIVYYWFPGTQSSNGH